MPPKSRIGPRCHKCTFLNQSGSSKCEVCESDIGDSLEGICTAATVACKYCSFENSLQDESCLACEKSLLPTTAASNNAGACNGDIGISLGDSCTATATVACIHCSFENSLPNKSCAVCEKSLAYEPSTSASDNTGDETWICRKCTYCNPTPYEIISICEMCGCDYKDQKKLISKSCVPTGSDCKTNSNEQLTECGHGKDDSNNEFSTSTKGIIELMQLVYELSNSVKLTFTYKLCSPMLHISQKGIEGQKWSCGYRNIQMMCSSLMGANAEYKARLFNGSGTVPDVYGLQVWIQRAWDDQFDTEGAMQLGGELIGSDTWIGATECCTLLRYMGVRAQIVDFMSDDFHQKRQRKLSNQIPMLDQDMYVDGFPEDDAGDAWEDSADSRPVKRRKKASTSCVVVGKGTTGPNIGNAILEWVQGYYESTEFDADWSAPSTTSTTSATSRQDNSMRWIQKVNDSIASDQYSVDCVTDLSQASPIVLSSACQPSSSSCCTSGSYVPPLYFQHNGHSRTIIGYENELGCGGKSDEASLLVFDPASDGKVLRNHVETAVKGYKAHNASLTNNVLSGYFPSAVGSNTTSVRKSTAGKLKTKPPAATWKRMVKRKVSSLKHSAYQIVYVSPGFMSAAERETSKVL